MASRGLLLLLVACLAITSAHAGARATASVSRRLSDMSSQGLLQGVLDDAANQMAIHKAIINAVAAITTLAQALVSNSSSTFAQAAGQAYILDTSDTALVLAVAMFKAKQVGHGAECAAVIQSAAASGGPAADAIAQALAQTGVTPDGGCDTITPVMSQIYTQAQINAQLNGTGAQFAAGISKAQQDVRCYSDCQAAPPPSPPQMPPQVSPQCPPINETGHKDFLVADRYLTPQVPAIVCPLGGSTKGGQPGTDWQPSNVNLTATPTDWSLTSTIYATGRSGPLCYLYKGSFRPNASGTWTFNATGDDGLHLWTGGDFLGSTTNWLISIVWQGTKYGQSEWYVPGLSNIRSASVDMDACNYYPFLVLSCNCQGPYAREINFSGPGFSSYLTNGTGFFYHTADEEK